ncbi:MAG: hydroxyisourate hydrolase [Ginsengibacter sp.]
MKYIIALFLLFGTIQTQAQQENGQLSTHILDIGKGLPATGVTVELEKMNEQNNTWSLIDKKVTDSNGRIPDFLNKKKDNEGIYKLVFKVADYFKSNHTETFYPFIEVVFQIKGSNHFHVPITLSPFGYSTYRGS